ncbi:single-stranded-DNA-specific exonuclease RecJ [Bombilactobacillus thymidiniphilus]|uniref:Single-stranded-DNA-specific exonuclease RecJ n=1 Tax=Bombilactobacillus thymidiniphilus TaxID=2923363 RepID=A0ABY4PCW7_9LACO|nr:single-stranded-DNA-specific exonuclease RecJ [Bombilactobacillus thymidiniphilus]UQS83513.1 single-stranded-DNA-specific exonuclease RecJ [Bombilactobacillus thymidiniphilus]
MSLRYQWHLLPKTDKQKEAQLVKDTGLPLFLVKLLLNRGINNSAAIQSFLQPSTQQISDPFLMHDMNLAVERISNAIMNSEKMVIYGDYDADGITSTAILKEAIETLGGQVDIFIPDRFKDGYGPNLKRYQKFVAQGYHLIITVDNGITGLSEVTYAQEHGVDVIVSDHHTIPDQLPPAYAIVHPQFKQEIPYPCPYLSGAGVAFKIASALLEEIPYDLLDLAAIGTVSDVMELVGENRALVALGLQQIKQQERLGLVELCKVAHVQMQDFNEEDIGFQIAPRLNALGRLANATTGVELLTTLDSDRAHQLAQEINQLNEKRKHLGQEVFELAWQQAQEQIAAGDKILVVAGDNWHQGILGIVAGKILQRSGCPCLVLSINNSGQAVGSGRSSANFDLYQALMQFRAMYQKFGGHAQACGMTLAALDVDNLRQQLNQLPQVRDLDTQLQASEQYELELRLSGLTLKLYKQIQRLAPFGNGNPVPVIKVTDFDQCMVDYLGKKNQDHLKISLQQQSKKIDCMGFGMGEYQPTIQQNGLQAVYGTLMTNNWRNQSYLQLKVDDLQLQAEVQLARAKNIQFVDLRQKPKFSVPKDLPSFVFFQAANQQKFMAQHGQCATYLSDEVPNLSKLVVTDMPTHMAQFDDLIIKLTNVEQLSFIFHDPNQTWISISKDNWHQTLKYLFSHKNLQVTDLPVVARYLQLSTVQIKVIIRVFSELNFVTIVDGFLKWPQQLPAHQLDESVTYCRLQERQKIQSLLVESDFSQLIDYVLQLRH